MAGVAVALPAAGDSVLDLFDEHWERRPSLGRWNFIRPLRRGLRLRDADAQPKSSAGLENLPRGIPESGVCKAPASEAEAREREGGRPGPSSASRRGQASAEVSGSHPSTAAIQAAAGIRSPAAFRATSWPPATLHRRHLPSVCTSTAEPACPTTEQDTGFQAEESQAGGLLQLTDDVLRQVFMALSPADLSRASQVCRKWRELATCPTLHSLCFLKTWGLSKIEGTPSRLSFWRLDLPPFVLRHTLKPSDTVTSVAVQYGCEPASIRRTNNMMSDSAVHTRMHLLVQLSQQVLDVLERHASSEDRDAGKAGLASRLKAFLSGKQCRVEFDKSAKRDVGVIILDSGCADVDKAGDEQAQQQAAQQTEAQRADARAKVVRLLMRAFGVDEATASFYLEEANGDVRAASQEMRSDLRWEQSHRQGPRT